MERKLAQHLCCASPQKEKATHHSRLLTHYSIKHSCCQAAS